MAEKLEVTIIGAQGLKHLNHFTGDGLYAICEIVHADQHQHAVKWQTQIQKDTLDPTWNETQVMEPWIPGEGLRITCYDKGLLGSKVEGKAELSSEYFEQQGFEGTIPIEGIEHATLSVRVVPLGAPQQQPDEQTYAAPPQTYAAPPQQHEQHFEQHAAAAQAHAAPPVHAVGPPQKLRVAISHASGLHHLNHFAADKPYCVCEVMHAEKRAKHTKCQTNAVVMPAKEDAVTWNEELALDPWYEGEPLVFTVYDKGLMGSKVEAKATLPSEYFYPDGFQGEIPFEGLPDGSSVFVNVLPDGPSADTHAPVGSHAPVGVAGAQEALSAQHPSHADVLQQVQSSLPPGCRIVGEPKFSHTSYAPVKMPTQPGVAHEFAVSTHPMHQPGMQTITYPAPQTMTIPMQPSVAHMPHEFAVSTHPMHQPGMPTMTYPAPQTMTMPTQPAVAHMPHEFAVSTHPMHHAMPAMTMQPGMQSMTYPAPQTMTHTAPPMMSYAAPQTMAQAAPPMMSYAAPQTTTHMAPPTMSYAAPQTMTYANRAF